MSEETIITRTPAMRRRTWIIRGVLWSFVIVVFSFVTGCTLLIEPPIHLLFGWVFHGMTTLPPLLANWRMALFPAGCLVLAGVLIHRFVCRSLGAKEVPLSWRPAHTMASLALLLLGCGAAIALSGVVHQTVWLMGDPWTENRGRRAKQTQAVSNARQVLLALHEFHDAEGHYPSSLRELEGKFIHSPKLVWVETETSRLPEAFIFLKPGGTISLTEVEPLIVSPVFESRQKIVVGYSDNSVTSLPAGKLESILKGGGKKKIETTPHP